MQLMPVMRSAEKWASLIERARLFVASCAISLSFLMLRLTYRLYRARLLIFADVKYAVHFSEMLRRLSWRLVRWK